jgi:hypothetical protein
MKQFNKTLTDEDLLADTLDAMKTADSSSWKVADNFAELARRGWTQTRFGKECGVSQ